MRRIISRSIFALLLMTGGAVLAQDRVGDFSLLDQYGNHHNMKWYDDHAAIALLVQANGSQATRQALPEYLALEEKYAGQGIRFFMINPMGRLDRDAVARELAQTGSDIPVLMDDTQQIAKALGIVRTGEVLLFDPSSFRVVFRGPVGNAFELALTAMINGQEIATPVVAMSGSDVSYASHGQVSYERDIAPILAENCAACHREGGIAPFALNSHAMAQGWSPMIREVLMTRRMPPGQIDRHVHEFENGRYLEIEEYQKIFAWIDAGSPRDGARDPLAELTWPETKWTVPYGEPDLVVKVPAQEIPASGVLDYVNLTVPIEGMLKDRWIRASEFSPGDPTVVHHSTARVVPSRAAGNDAGEGAMRNSDIALISRYVPGQEARIEGDNTGGLLPRDSSLYVTLHYTTTGKETVDESEYAIWFYPEGEIPRERMVSTLVGRFANDWTAIPPHEKNFEMSNSFEVKDDINILAYHPHMHFRGKDLRMFADYPDGTREELINIPYYSYLWQLTYRLSEPKFVPAGTVITSVGHFDNSAQNPFNPDPSVTVPWGEMSWDEMFFGEFVYKAANH